MNRQLFPSCLWREFVLSHPMRWRPVCAFSLSERVTYFPYIWHVNETAILFLSSQKLGMKYFFREKICLQIMYLLIYFYLLGWNFFETMMLQSNLNFFTVVFLLNFNFNLLINPVVVLDYEKFHKKKIKIFKKKICKFSICNYFVYLIRKNSIAFNYIFI